MNRTLFGDPVPYPSQRPRIRPKGFPERTLFKDPSTGRIVKKDTSGAVAVVVPCKRVRRVEGKVYRVEKNEAGEVSATLLRRSENPQEKTPLFRG